LSNSPAAFERNARAYNDYLSSLFTRTITEHPLRPIIRPHGAFISFRGAERFGDSPNVELENGCRIRVSQTILPNSEDHSKVTTAEYSYSYALGPDPDKDWLLRYDYVPDEPVRNPEYEYPVAHVHFNGVSEAYDRLDQAEDKPLHKLHCPTERITVEDFIEHLIIEFDALTGEKRTVALALLAQSRRRFHEQERTRRPPYDVLERNP
jgi:hypothetical protein